MDALALGVREAGLSVARNERKIWNHRRPAAGVPGRPASSNKPQWRGVVVRVLTGILAAELRDSRGERRPDGRGLGTGRSSCRSARALFTAAGQHRGTMGQLDGARLTILASDRACTWPRGGNRPGDHRRSRLIQARERNGNCGTRFCPACRAFVRRTSAGTVSIRW